MAAEASSSSSKPAMPCWVGEKCLKWLIIRCGGAVAEVSLRQPNPWTSLDSWVWLLTGSAPSLTSPWFLRRAQAARGNEDGVVATVATEETADEDEDEDGTRQYSQVILFIIPIMVTYYGPGH